MIEQGFNYAASTIKEMTDFFETREENLEHKEDKNKSSKASKKNQEKKSSKEKKKVRLRLKCHRVRRRGRSF